MTPSRPPGGNDTDTQKSGTDPSLFRFFSRLVLRWKEAFPQGKETEHEHEGHHQTCQGHTHEQGPGDPLRQGAAGEGELRSVRETPTLDREGGENEGVDRPQPQEPAVQSQPLRLVPCCQPGEVGKELEVEVDAPHRDQQVRLQQAVDFSESYLNDGFRIAVAAGNDFTADNISALKDKVVAVKHNSFALAMVNDFGGAAKVIETPSIEEAMAKVIGGEADCAVISKSAGSFFIANGYADKIKFASGDLKTDNVALAVRKGDKEFLSKLNEGLRNFRKSQEFDRLKKTYFGEF